METKQVFLSNFNSDELYNGLKVKIENKELLTDEDVMKCIILPLTDAIAKNKQNLIEKTINLVRDLKDEQQLFFIIAGILVATDKFIDKDYSNMIKEWVCM